MHKNRARHILFIVILLLPCIFAQGQEVKDSVKIHFRQGYSTLDLSLGNNRASLNRIIDTLTTTTTDSLYKLKEVTVIGSASPEGSIELNKRLSEKRANTLLNYMSQYGNLPTSSQKFIFLGRDWAGLLQLVRADEQVPYRDEVIKTLEDIVHKTQDEENLSDNNLQRLANLRGGEPYRYMYRNLFPELRASRMIVSYDRLWNPTRINPNYIELGVDEIATIIPEEEQQLEPMPLIYKEPSCTKPLYISFNTNIFYDVALIPNIGTEFYLGNNYSVSANWHYAWWKNDPTSWYWRTYGGDIALRYWWGKAAAKKPLTGWHAGVYGQMITYDFELGGPGILADRWSWSAGVECGYSLPIARRLNLDFNFGVGYHWGIFKEYIPIDGHYVWQATKRRRYMGPTKAEISLVWLIGCGNYNK